MFNVIKSCLFFLVIVSPLISKSQAISTTFGDKNWPFDSLAATKANIVPNYSVVDKLGNIYITDQNCIRKISNTGIITTIAGTGIAGFSGDGGLAKFAKLNRPQGIAIDSLGNIYFADFYNNRIRKILTDGKIITIAGDSLSGYSGDGGQAKFARLYNPNVIALDAQLNIYISDFGNNRIRLISNDGIITTIAGGTWPFNGAQATTACIYPNNLTHDANGNIYFSDVQWNRILKISTTGIISILAGKGTRGYSGDGGKAIDAELSNPGEIITDAGGNIYFDDAGNNRIRKVDKSGIITTITGNGVPGYSGDGGLSKVAQIGSDIRGLYTDATGNLYFSDVQNQRIRKIASNNIINTIVGNGTMGGGGDGGNAIFAQVANPYGVTWDLSGNIYFIDYSNQRIRKIATNGIITTFLVNGQNGFSLSGGAYEIKMDQANNLYVRDFYSIQKIPISTAVSTIVVGIRSRPNGEFIGDGGLATAVGFANITGLSIDNSGNIYFVDLQNKRVRKVNTAGILSTIAGNGFASFAGDGGSSSLALFNNPYGITVDKNNNIYICDVGNYRIRKINSNGVITTFAGGGTNTSDGISAELASIYPIGIALDKSGNLYFNDVNNLVRKVSNTNIITTVAGVRASGINYSGDGGAAQLANIYGPLGITFDNDGNIIICDNGNKRIRRISAFGYINTIAGNGFERYYGDGEKSSAVGFNYPSTITKDKLGNFYIFDQGNTVIRKVSTTGLSSTIAGTGVAGYTGDGGSATLAKIGLNLSSVSNSPGIAVDDLGNVYICDMYNHRVRKIATNGIISTFAGDGTTSNSGDGGPASAAKLYLPESIALDRNGNMYISSRYSIRKINNLGVITTIVGSNSSIGFSGDGGPASSALVNRPKSLTFDSKGNLYFIDMNNYRVRKVDNFGIITTVAGTGSSALSADGDAITSSLYSPMALAIDSNDNLYVSESFRIRKISSLGKMTTIAGSAFLGFSGDGGAAINATMTYVPGMIIDTNNNLLFVDRSNHRIRKISNATLNATNTNFTLKSCYGNNSNQKSFLVFGSQLIDSVIVTASKNIECSLNASSGYSSFVSLPNTGDSLRPTEIFFRLKNNLDSGVNLDTIYISSISAIDKIISISDSVIMIPNLPKVLEVNYCLGDNPFKLTANSEANHSLQWYGTVSTGGVAGLTASVPNIASIGTANYYVSQLSNLTNCESNRAIIPVNVFPIPAIPFITRDSTLFLASSAKIGNKWYFNNVELADTSVRFKPTLQGLYTLKTTQNGCASSLSAPYYFLTTDVINLSANEFIKLTPNPFVNQLNFDFAIKGYQKLNMEIYDIATGSKLVNKQSLSPGTPIYLGQLSAGTYIVKILSSDNKIAYQFKMVKL